MEGTITIQNVIFPPACFSLSKACVLSLSPNSSIIARSIITPMPPRASVMTFTEYLEWRENSIRFLNKNAYSSSDSSITLKDSASSTDSQCTLWNYPTSNIMARKLASPIQIRRNPSPVQYSFLYDSHRKYVRFAATYLPLTHTYRILLHRVENLTPEIFEKVYKYVERIEREEEGRISEDRGMRTSKHPMHVLDLKERARIGELYKSRAELEWLRMMLKATLARVQELKMERRRKRVRTSEVFARTLIAIGCRAPKEENRRRRKWWSCKKSR
ncbi:hypothetical protein BDV96DRAFT_652022 [Lophiotrema nucula]|uniref:Uncharacterized protein n=1 Tax=Lophiotrema nucula TaxID=690887 RepID=A0A6A5YR11_9PLEO|nr:hypothetical protein BDV96DRAFT_652022 [Lophiotrema nucula]